jgi:tight adherence protein B
LVVAFAPFGIGIGAAAIIAVLFWSFWERVFASLSPLAEKYRTGLEQAQIRLSREELLLIMVGSAVVLWTAYMFLARPGPAMAALMLPASLAVVFYATGSWIRGRIRKRLRAFNDQLEMVLRLLSSGLRVGLSMRQAFVLVIDEMAEPAKLEFRRVIAQTNIGIGVNEALEALAVRMPSDELNMMVRTIRVQSQTGGNLGKILDHLAATIKDRRRIDRKIKALTAEGTASGWVIGCLPVIVGLFITLTQPHMRDSMFHTAVGLSSLGLAVALEVVGVFLVMHIVKLDI